jgi:two-component system phosphate regulon sensor histidine kinase PhoR
MKRNVKNIFLGLAILVLLPILILINFQISSISENENLIHEVYNEQLDAILFSLNQYAQDVVNDWQTNISTQKNQNNKLQSKNKYQEVFNNNRPIKCIFTITDNQQEIICIQTNQENRYKKYIQNLQLENQNLISSLQKYEKQGYYKNQAIIYNDSLQTVIFLISNDNKNVKLGGVIFSKEEFITETLAPKFQEVIKDKFILFVENDSTNIFTSESFENKESSIKKELWVIPSYKVGILLKGKTIDELMGQRFLYNFILLFATLLVIVVAGVFVFKAINKEIKLAQLKSDFVSNVSHELKTPLSLISMFSETLEMGKITSEEKKQEYYSIIHNETNRLTKIVTSVLNFSKMEAGKREFNFAENDLNNIIEQIIETYDYHFKSLGFSCNYEKVNLPNILCDKVAITEAIINLIDNAIKYSNNKKLILIKTKIENKFIVCEIEDFGIGISEDDQKKVFDKFYRATTGNIHDTKGTGLGLSIVKSIIDAHNGEISISSKIDNGTAFRLSFPQIKKG